MEIILVGIIALVAKIAELYCSNKKPPTKKCIYIAISSLVATTVLIILPLALFIRNKADVPITHHDIYISLGCLIVVLFVSSYRCSLHSSD
jgi:hypothetical protein